MSLKSRFEVLFLLRPCVGRIIDCVPGTKSRRVEAHRIIFLQSFSFSHSPLVAGNSCQLSIKVLRFYELWTGAHKDWGSVDVDGLLL
jgi:hypothetical protein